jgi:hypothetical protein
VTSAEREKDEAADAPEPADGETAAPAVSRVRDHELGRLRRTRIGRWFADLSQTNQVALVVAAVGLVGALAAAMIPAWLASDETPEPRLGVQATIVNTHDDQTGASPGVFTYPSADSNAGRLNGPAEGEVVRVVCQIRDGRLVTDTPYNGRQTSSRVWDRLESSRFISDIYTTLPKTPGPNPPSGLPLCQR